MPRLEHAREATFFEIEKSEDGKSFTARWGTTGTDGKSKTKAFEDAYSCSEEYERILKERERLGYRVAKPKLAVNRPTNPELEAALFDAIDDEARWSVYADWLQQVGDVRGELIALGLAKQTAAAQHLAEAKEHVLWGDAWYLRDDPFAKLTWVPAWNDDKPIPVEISFSYQLGKLGFIESVGVAGLEEAGHVAKAMHEIVSAPIGRFIQSISLAATHEDRYSGASGQPNLDKVVAAIARAQPTALRSLEITTGGYQISWTDTGKLAPLLAATPHLAHLSIEMGDIDLGDALHLPKLHHMKLETGGLDRKNVLAIANATWPALQELIIYFGRPDYGGNATAADVEALLASSYPALTSLALCNSEIAGDIVRALVKSPLLAQLEVLDLSKGTLVDEDVAPIINNLGALEKLRRLDLSTNYLTADFEAMLQRELGDVFHGGEQRYDDMVRDRTQYANDEWARTETFRYADLGE